MHAFLLRSVLARLAALAAALLLAACSPQFDWREQRGADGSYAFVLPGKPQLDTRELAVPVDGSTQQVRMEMHAAGVGPSLFAVGAARLPAALLTDAQLPATVAWFREGLLRNLNGTPGAPQDLQVPAAVSGERKLRYAQALTARGTLRGGKPAQLLARFYVIDDTLYQLTLIAAPDEVPPQAQETFFDAFRLQPLR